MAGTGMSDELLFHLEGGVATVTINRPDKRNALNAAVIDGLGRAIAQVKDDAEARVLVLTGAGDKAFCAGADLTVMFPEGSGEGDVIGPHEARGALARLFTELWQLGKPTVARVNGYCLAGGFGLALACDMVVASDTAQFGTPEINVGLWPYMITVPLARSMPPKVALELMMTGRRVGADEALRIGFVNSVVPLAELDATVAGLTSQLAGASPAAMRLGKSAFYRVWDMEAGQALDFLQSVLTVTTMTGDAREGVTAFAEKRSPHWTGR